MIKNLINFFAKNKKPLSKDDIVLLMALRVRKVDKIKHQTLNIFKDGQWQKHTYL